MNGAVRIRCWTIALLVFGTYATSSGQEPKNLQFFPKGTPRDSLVQIMRGFSFALGVRCQYCHVGGDGISFEGVEFERDDDPDKRKARFMLAMMKQINEEMLSQIPDRDNPPVRIQCKTCHRGRSRPILLKQELRMIIEEAGVDSAIARYRELREKAPMDGMFDFGEWEINTLAEDLAREGRSQEAIAIYRLNEEFFGRSLSIRIALAQLYDAVGDTTNAIHWYEKVLEIRPDRERSLQRLEALRKEKK